MYNFLKAEERVNIIIRIYCKFEKYHENTGFKAQRTFCALHVILTTAPKMRFCNTSLRSIQSQTAKVSSRKIRKKSRVGPTFLIQSAVSESCWLLSGYCSSI